MAVGRIVAGIFILSIFAITKISSLGPCEPDCSGIKDFGKVVDPKNCTNYYTCMHEEPLDHSTPCPDGKKFDTATSECIDGTDCEPLCGGGGSGTCVLTCSEKDHWINDPLDCNIYYECGPAGPGPEEHCPANIPYYNSTGQICVNDESVCCVPGCEVNCVEVPSLIPDPLDCTKYYLCQDTGEPTEDFHFKCDEGQSFDLGSGQCSSDAKCQTLCAGSTTAGGSTAAGGSTISPASGATTGSGGSSVPMTSPAVPATTGDCVESWTCDAIGNFPKCQSCQRKYFSCSAIDQPGKEMTCSEGYAFNTDPAYPACVLATNCPYHPHKDLINFLKN